MSLTLEQKEFRRRGVSASDIPAICGLSPWKSPIRVWEEKVQEPEEDEEATVDQERGNELEDALLNWMGRRTETKIFHNTGKKAITFQNPKHELVLATPDGLAFDGELPRDFSELREKASEAVCVAEVKSPGPFTARDWISPLEVSDGVPEYYLPQVQWQMGALEKQEGLVGPLIGRDLWVYRLSFNPEMFDLLLAKTEKFWEYVIKQEPPPIDGSKDFAAYLAKTHPRHSTENLRQSNSEIDVAAVKLQEARDAIKSMEEVTRFQENTIKEFIGDSSGVSGHWGKILWRLSKDRESWDANGMAEWFRQNKPEALEKFRKVSPGSRPFKPYFK